MARCSAPTSKAGPTERVRDVLRSRHYFHAMHFPRAFHMHPLNYALGLAARGRAGGRAHLRGHAGALDRSRRRAQAHRDAAGAGAREPHRARRQRPPRRVDAAGGRDPAADLDLCVVTAPLGQRLLEAIRYRGAVSDTDLADNHYRIVGGDRLMLSGRSTTWEADPRRYVDKLKADLAEIYPQIGNVEVDHVWSGVLGNALHRMPQIGELAPGFWMASRLRRPRPQHHRDGRQHHGARIVDGDDTWRLFSPYEFVWAGGKLGRAVKQVYYWWFHARERYEARQAREREEEVERVNGRDAAIGRPAGDDRA